MRLPSNIKLIRTIATVVLVMLAVMEMGRPIAFGRARFVELYFEMGSNFQNTSAFSIIPSIISSAIFSFLAFWSWPWKTEEKENVPRVARAFISIFLLLSATAETRYLLRAADMFQYFDLQSLSALGLLTLHIGVSLISYAIPAVLIYCAVKVWPRNLDRPSKLRRGGFFALTAVTLLTSWAIVHVALRRIGVAVYAIARGKPLFSIVYDFLVAGAEYAAAIALFFVACKFWGIGAEDSAAITSPPSPLLSWKISTGRHFLLLVLGIVVLYDGVNYSNSLRTAEAYQFGDVYTTEPNYSHIERNPGYPAVEYSNNRHGFRGPDWSIEKPPRTIRGAIIGDSFIYGKGVEWADTIGQNVQRKLAASSVTNDRVFEIINLGILGNNALSYAVVHREALRQLDIDFALITLTTQNDINSWDRQRERRALSQPSLFSATKYLFGRGITSRIGATLSGAEWMETLDVLEDAAALFTQNQKTVSSPPPIWFFPFKEDEIPFEDYFSTIPNAHFIPAGRIDGPREQYFVAGGTGHPGPKATEAYAGQMVDFLLNDPTFLTLVETRPAESDD